MIDLLHLPEPDERVVWFPGQGVSSNISGWRVWNKPRGISMVAILAIGSGGGGGGGAANSSNVTAGGGAGGGGAAMAKMLWPAWALPDRLYVLSRSGGLGGSGAAVAGNNGTAGIVGASSLVSIYPDPSATAGSLLLTTATGALLGTAGTTSAGGAAAAAPTIPSATDAPLGQMAATQLFIQGTARTAGSTGTAASSITPEIICRGAPGGGKATSSGAAGGGYSAIAETLLNAVPGGTAQTGADASSGFIHAGVHYGGCGGGGNNLGVGGRGGNGVAWGAGGGGGGGGLTGGRGGDGGPGLVIIASW